MPEQNFSNSQFGLWKKWFWIGIVAAIFSPVVGLVYGVALAIEKDRRREGIIIGAIAIVWAISMVFFIIPWLSQSYVRIP